MDNDKIVDLDDEEVDPNVITLAHALAASGLGAMEGGGRFFHVVNARPSTAQELTDSLGPEGTLLVTGNHWDPDRLHDQIEVLNRTVGPCRVVFGNLGSLLSSHCWPIEEVMRHRGVKSFWFVDDATGDIPTNIDHKVLMQAQMVDAATLLDAVAFGWGAKNPYTGQSVEDSEADFYGSAKDAIPSDTPLFGKRGETPL